MSEMGPANVFDDIAWQCLLWAIHSARTEESGQIELRHLALGITAAHARMAEGQSAVLSPHSAHTLLDAAHFSIEMEPPSTAQYIPVPHIELPLARDAAELISESVRAVGATEGLARVGASEFLQQLLLKLRPSVEDDSVSAEGLLRAFICPG